MITARDLKDIDFFLMERQAIVNQSKWNKNRLHELRIKIADELSQIKIELKQKNK